MRGILRLSALASVLALAVSGRPALAEAPAAPGFMGGTGLVRTPTARLLPDGTLAAGASAADGWRHQFLSAALLPGVEATLRRTKIAGAPAAARADLKLRLLAEGRYRPELAVGMRGIGAGGDGGDAFLVLSRRWWDADLSVGVGTGDRHGFEPPFPGPRAAVFGGLAWHLPSAALTFQAEFDSRYIASGRNAVPVDLALAWRPLPWLDLGIGVEHGRRVTARAALLLRPVGPPPPPAPPPVIPGRRPGGSAPGTAGRRLAGALAEAGLAAAAVRVAPPAATVWLDRLPPGPTARTVGRTARVMAREAPPAVERFEIVLQPDRLDGSAVAVTRTDLERAASHRGSPAELWRTARLEAVREDAPSPRPRWSLRLTPRVEIDPAGPGGALQRRAAADLGVRRHDGNWLLTGAVRFNLAADAAGHAARPVALAELHSAWMWSPGKGWHLRYAGGFLEETFAGHSAEALLRPPGARWAAGIQADLVARRTSPASFIGPVPLFSGLLGAYYEAADGGAHGALHLGRYLGGDLGATLEFERRLPSGLALRAHATWTDAMAGRGGADIGLGMALPLGRPAAFPLDVSVEAGFRRLGRDAGQRLDQPLPLYRLTGPGSYGRVAGSWRHVLE